ncbi:hypothetical protein AALB39_00095 [Lachnospiraceae bacterium 54-53]
MKLAASVITRWISCATSSVGRTGAILPVGFLYVPHYAVYVPVDYMLKIKFKVDKGCRIGRSYKDFCAFLEKTPEKTPDTNIVQMDSVIGEKGGKCLLTIHFVECSFMLAFLCDANTSKSVTDIYDKLYQTLGHELFKKLFPVILTGNGSEFSDPGAIECGSDRYTVLKTRVFYYDTGSPYQKGAHINSYKRKKLNNRSPYEPFSFYHGEEVLQKLGVIR